MTIRTWNGSSDPISTAADWSPTGVPVEGDTAIIGSGGPTATGLIDGYEIDLASADATNQPVLLATTGTLGSFGVISLGEATGATAYGTVLAEGKFTNEGQIIAPGAGGTLTVALAGLPANPGQLGALLNDGFISATGGTVQVEGVLPKATLTNDGTIGAAGGGTVDLDARVAGTGRIVLQGAATVSLAQSVSAGQTVSFAGSAATPERLNLLDPANVQAELRGLGTGDSIDVPGTATATVSGSTLIVTVSAVPGQGSAVDPLDIGAGYTSANFTVAPDGAGGTLIGVVCYARGTRLLTAAGERAVEDLAPGDTVTTLSGEESVVRWVGRRRVDIARHPSPESVRPVRIAAHAFADGLPRRDLLVSPEHALFVDGVLIPARRLVNGTTIAQDTPAAVEYFHVELDRHDVLLAEGLPAESYLDTGNRDMFANAPVVALQPTPTGTTGPDACAPLVLDGPALDAVRSRLAERAPILAARRAA